MAKQVPFEQIVERFQHYKAAMYSAIPLAYLSELGE